MCAAAQTAISAEDVAIDLAAETLYRFFAAALRKPNVSGRGRLTDDGAAELAQLAAELLRSEFAGSTEPLGFGELPTTELDLRPALALYAADDLDAEHQRVFGLVMCRECPPYETEFQPVDEPFFRSQQMADISGFYRAFGLTLSDQWHERPDHLSLELEFLAFLLMKRRLALADPDAAAAERATVCQQARVTFFRDHVNWWAASWACALWQKAETGFYAVLARALASFLSIERRRLGIEAAQTPQQVRVAAVTECEGCLVELKT